MSYRLCGVGLGTVVACVLVSVSMGVGCGAGAGQDEGEGATTEVQSALTWRTFWTLGTGSNDFFDMGSSSDRTCFLSGVAGNINAGDACCASGAFVQRKADEVLLIGGAGHSVGGLINVPVQARATCVASTTNHVAAVLGPTDHSVTLGAVTPNRQCFLTGVWGTAGAWASPSAYVRVVNDGVNWYLTGNLFAFFNNNTTQGGAEADCFDVPPGTWVGTGSWSAADPGTFTANIGWDSSPVTAMACGLTGIQGRLSGNDLSDGALINIPSAFPGEWTMTLKNGKRAWVTCLQ